MLSRFKSHLVSITRCFLLPPWNGFKAYADPPSWVPANAYRNKHHQNDNHEDWNNDDEDRQHVIIVPTQPVYVVPYGIAQGTCNRKLPGQVLDGAAGVAIGSQIGGDRRNTAAIIGGGIVGVMVSGNIGESMDCVDQGCIGQILEHASDGRQVTWVDPNSRKQYQVKPEKALKNRHKQDCDAYLTNADIDGYERQRQRQRQRQVTSTACCQSNGVWQMLN